MSYCIAATGAPVKSSIKVCTLIASMLLVACVHSASPVRGQEVRVPSPDSLVFVSPCREHLIARNFGLANQEYLVRSPNGHIQHASAQGRVPTWSAAYAATVVVVREPADSIAILVGQRAIWLTTSARPCVRPLPDTNPDQVNRDYFEAAPSTYGPTRDAPNHIGSLIVRFVANAPRSEIDALVMQHSLALIGGSYLTPESERWVFWIEDSEAGARTAQVVRDLAKSPLVALVMAYPILRYQ